MHQLKWVALAVTAALAGCNLGPSADPSSREDSSELHAAVMANANVILSDALVDLSEALPPMTTNAEPET